MRSHGSTAFLLFIDLKKAYDSVPRAALWLALKKLGVPDQIVTLIQSFHDDMIAQIRLDGNLLEEITVDNGLCILVLSLSSINIGDQSSCVTPLPTAMSFVLLLVLAQSYKACSVSDHILARKAVS